MLFRLESRKSVLVRTHEDDGPSPRHDYVVVLGGSHGTPYLVNMGTNADGTGMHIAIKGTGDQVNLFDIFGKNFIIFFDQYCRLNSLMKLF